MYRRVKICEDRVGVGVSPGPTGRVDRKSCASVPINTLRSAPETHLILLGAGKHLGGWLTLAFSIVSTVHYLWGPSSLLSSGNRDNFIGKERGRGLKLTTNLHLLSRLRMRGAIPLFPICLHRIVLN